MCFALLGVAEGQSDWTITKNSNGVIVYTKTNPSTGLKDSKVKTTLKTTADKVLTRIQDVSSHPQWMDRIKESKLLKKISDSDYVVYYHVVAPWPVSDRDVVSHYKVRKLENGKIEIVVTAEPDYIPQKEDLVRIPMAHTIWTLTPNPDGTISLEYFNQADPGGSLPDWAVNMAASDQPFNTMTMLKKLVEGGK